MGVVVALLAALLAAVIPASASWAQTDEGMHLQRFTQSDFYKGVINRAIATVPPAVFQKCPSLVSTGSRVTVLKPVSFGQSGFPNAGLWKQSFPISGCGNDTVLNFYFSASADEKINTVIGIPGTTHADLTLGRDTLLYANMGAALIAKDCKSFVVKNTKFEGFGHAKAPIADPGPGKSPAPWWETWTMIGCDRTVDVPIEYAPDATGTQITQPGGAVAH
jgi:hypothetical protein